MTIAQYAQSVGSSKQTAYRKLRNAGIDLEEIRDQDGQLTPAGMDILKRLLAKPVSQSTGVSVSETVSANSLTETEIVSILRTVASQQATIESLTNALNILTEQVQALERAQEQRDPKTPKKDSLISSFRSLIFRKTGTHSVPPVEHTDQDSE